MRSINGDYHSLEVQFLTKIESGIRRTVSVHLTGLLLQHHAWHLKMTRNRDLSANMVPGLELECTTSDQKADFYREELEKRLLTSGEVMTDDNSNDWKLQR